MFDQAKAQYRGSVPTAMQNVAGVSHALQSDTNVLYPLVESARAGPKSRILNHIQIFNNDTGDRQCAPSDHVDRAEGTTWHVIPYLIPFQERFTGTLAMALAVYPEAKVEVEEKNVTLHASRPPASPRLVAVGR